MNANLLAAPVTWVSKPKLVVLAKPVSVPELSNIFPAAASGVPLETFTLSGVVEPTVMLPTAVELAVMFKLK